MDFSYVFLSHPLSTLEFKRHEQVLKNIQSKNAAKEAAKKTCVEPQKVSESSSTNEGAQGEHDIRNDESMNGMLPGEDMQTVPNDRSVIMNNDDGLELSIDQFVPSETIGQPLLNSTEILIENAANDLRKIGLDQSE